MTSDVDEADGLKRPLTDVVGAVKVPVEDTDVGQSLTKRVPDGIADPFRPVIVTADTVDPPPTGLVEVKSVFGFSVMHMKLSVFGRVDTCLHHSRHHHTHRHRQKSSQILSIAWGEISLWIISSSVCHTVGRGNYPIFAVFHTGASTEPIEPTIAALGMDTPSPTALIEGVQPEDAALLFRKLIAKPYGMFASIPAFVVIVSVSPDHLAFVSKIDFTTASCAYTNNRSTLAVS